MREKNEKWKGPVPVFAETLLPKIISRLMKKDTLKIVDYGDSITEGASRERNEIIKLFSLYAYMG